MKILILIKMVSELSYTETLGGEGSMKSRLAGDNLSMNPADRYALEHALRLKDKNKDIHITVMTMGPLLAQQILFEALALGADAAIHVSDPAYAGSDTVATSTVLSNAIKTLPEQDLILCGSKSIDSETGHIGPQIAALMDIDYYTNIVDFSYSGNTVGVRYSFEGTMKETTVTLPVLLTVINGTSKVRIPTIQKIRSAKEKPFDTIDTTRVTSVSSCTETLKVIETPFSYRNGVRESELLEGVNYISDELCI